MDRNDYGRAYQEGFTTTVRFLLSRGAVPDLAEETAQAAWTRGWERIDQLRDQDLLKTWVNSIALNMYRHSIHITNRTQPLAEHASSAQVNTAAIDLAHVLNSCTSRDRSLLMRQMYGWTTKEMADEGNASETAMRIRLMRARRSARSRLEMRRAA